MPSWGPLLFISFTAGKSSTYFLAGLFLLSLICMSALYILDVKWSCSVVSDSLRPHRLEPTRLLCPWDFPGNSTGVDCHFLLQRIFPIQGSNPGLPHCRQTLYHLSHQEHTKKEGLEPVFWGDNSLSNETGRIIDQKDPWDKTDDKKKPTPGEVYIQGTKGTAQQHC